MSRLAAITLPLILSTLAVPIVAQTIDTPPRALIEGRNFPNLNDRNLADTRYDVAPPRAQATQFGFKLKGYVFGFKMITAHYNGYTEGQTYAAYTDIKYPRV